ncbi:SAICAR synthase-like protein [Pisolithus croceorrhizus]|nr:SAICAR synthase-like protein [Pisolithus croceorrhizus]KAI6128008.1 SAICAR synthase-like protein [Pisolithus croceorrhizus]
MTTDSSTSIIRPSSPHVAPRRSHTLPPTVPLSSQVGGHAGVQTTEDGSLLLKPALPRELEFYQLIRDGVSPDVDAATATASGLKPLLPWIPKFLGVLSLGNHLVDNLPEMAAVHDLPAFVQANGTATTIVLENLTHGFRKPCILDVKLGTVLYDEDAPPEKKERMIQTAANTTSLSTGVRLTGFQVYANDHPDPVLTPKKYGKTIKPEHLPDGIARFFPFRGPVSSTRVSPSIAAASNMPPSGDIVATPDNIQPGLPLHILLVLLTRLLEALERLRVALSTAEVRIVGGSVLIIYEGDWACAEKAARTSQSTSVLNGDATALGEGLDGNERGAFDEEGEDEEPITVEIDEHGHLLDDVVAASPVAESFEENDDDDDDDEEDEDEPRLFRLSLIDFAHTRLAPGQGPDTGVLLGIDTLIRLIHERRSVVQALVDEGAGAGADAKSPYRHT